MCFWSMQDNETGSGEEVRTFLRVSVKKLIKKLCELPFFFCLFEEQCNLIL